ncbi:Kinesin-like protein KIF22 [Dichanthelium oligosanthes]|uniref:Kinesin-like protein KIF22 n=1 Tax=Dichanthelium oligosanthes TaxID=888268 RepID=A0A1E5WAQ9_9POAL|nr:Kinesin-like protein KIF22 [Dichanthelium oligosanthes]
MEEAAAAIVAAPDSSSRTRRIRAAPVRVVARICPGGGSRGSFQVAARVSGAAGSSSASVSFIPITMEATPAAAGAQTPRKDCEYKLDYCYQKDDSYTRIFNNEGSQDHPGLLTMSMEQILHRAKPIGAAVSVSSYQVLQDNHVFDLLEPKDSEVHVLEDADGKTHLKGLSRVDIKSTPEFADLCCGESYKLKQSTKASNQLQARGHQGFVIYISRHDQSGKKCVVSKIHFLDLAGYVDTKQKNYGGGLVPSNSNKSLYAVMNVVQALNSNQSFIPYRPYKVTRILQDSLCKTSGAVLICCLDEVSCQDAVSTLTLASRSSQVVNDQFYNLSLDLKRPCIQPKNLERIYTGAFCIIQQEVQSSLGMAIQTSSPIEACDETEKAVDVLSSEMQEIVPWSVKKLISVDMQEKDPLCPLVQDHSSSDLQAENSYTDLGMTCSSDIADEFVEKTSVCATQSSPKLSDRLKEISNSLKLLSTRPVIITKQKTDMVCAQPFNTEVAEPKTPAVHLKFGHAEDFQDSLKGRSTGIKKSLAQECLTVLNSANKDQLKSLKGIGEKRANYILELREESPEPFKNIDDLRTIIGMNKKEVTSLYLFFSFHYYNKYSHTIQLRTYFATLSVEMMHIC